MVRGGIANPRHVSSEFNSHIDLQNMLVKCYGSTAVSKTASQSSTLCTFAKLNIRLADTNWVVGSSETLP